MIWFDRNIIIIIEKKQSYFDCGYHLMFSYTWERVWSVCVWVWVCVLRYLLACIYAWVNVYPTFYGDKLVKNWTGVLGQPALHGPHSPTGSPTATTYQEGRAEQMLPSAMTVPKRPCPAGLLCELQAWLRPDWTVTALSQAQHKKITITPWITIHKEAVCSASFLFQLLWNVPSEENEILILVLCVIGL